jgi:hypothetical protein
LVLAWANIQITNQNVYSGGIALVAATHVKELLCPCIASDTVRPRLCMDIDNGPVSSPDCEGVSTVV